MDINPILQAKLEFLAQAVTGIAVAYASGQMTDDDACTNVSEVLETFTQPVEAPKNDGHTQAPDA